MMRSSTESQRRMAEGVTDEAQLPTIMEGIGFQDVLTSYGDFRAGDASVKAVSNYEKKHNIKDGKPIGQPATGDGRQITNPQSLSMPRHLKPIC